MINTNTAWWARCRDCVLRQHDRCWGVALRKCSRIRSCPFDEPDEEKRDKRLARYERKEDDQ